MYKKDVISYEEARAMGDAVWQNPKIYHQTRLLLL